MRTRVRALLAVALALMAPLGAGAGEGMLKLQVLRAEAHGSALDVLLRIDAPADAPGDLGPESFAVYIAPAHLPAAEAATDRFRLRRVFLKRFGSSYYLDLRQLPPAVGGTALQLVVQVAHGDKSLLTHHLGQFLGPPADALDVALVIDESLSMTRTDPEWLRIAAAKAFVDLACRSTRIGHIALVAFNERARTLVPLTPTSQPEPLYREINKISAMGQTDVDAALAEAQKVLEKSPSPNKVAILLSDGKDEPGVYENAHRAFAQKRWRIFTIGLSKLADTQVLQRIASETGGDYHCAPTNAELHDIFSRICVTLHKKVLIRSRTLRLQPKTPTEDAMFVDDTISALTIGLDTAAPDVTFVLRDTTNRLLTPDLPKTDQAVTYNRKTNSQHYDLWSPSPGRCVARVTSPRAMEVTTTATADTPLLLRAYPVKPGHLRGERIEIAASLANGDAPLADARVEAVVHYPGTVSPLTVQLYDDGQHQDTAANDGVFACLLPAGEHPGQCTIRLVATGTTPAGHRFEREAQLSTTVLSEGYSRLWASAERLDFGLLYNGESASLAIDLKLISAVGGTEAETVRWAATDFRVPISIGNQGPAANLSLVPGEASRVAVALRIPPDQPPGRYNGTLEVASKYDRLSLPLLVEVRRPKIVVNKAELDLGAVESGAKVEAATEVRLEPKGAIPAKLVASDPRVSVTPSAVELGEKPAAIRAVLATSPDQATEEVKAKVVVETPIGTVDIPVVSRVVKPAFAVSPGTVDFGDVSPGQKVERQLALSLEGLVPREAAFASSPLVGPSGVPPLVLGALEPVRLKPGEPRTVPLRVVVPPVQPPGAYKGEILVRTPLGARKVACTANVAAASTFRVASVLDFEKVAVGTSKELVAEVTSLVDAEQRVEVRVPEASGDLVLAAEPAMLSLAPRGKGVVRLGLSASAAARPGPRTAEVTFRGPSRGASMEVRALIFRPPHDSLAFEPTELDVGRLQAGIPERFSVRLKSLVDEAQDVAIEEVDVPAHLVSVGIKPKRWTLAALASSVVELELSPLAGRDDEPFEATVVARGRSLPTLLRVRGSVFTPPRTTFVLLEPVLDFGPMTPGTRAELALAIQSVYPREQRISLAEPPVIDGIALRADRPGSVLLPGVMHPIGIELVVAPDAAAGERRVTWEVRGPGDSATFEVRVEIVPAQAPAFGTSLPMQRPGPLGWLDGVLLFVLLCLLLAILVATYLLARRLVLSARVPRMAKYFALSALLHVAAVFVALDIFVAEKVRKQELGPLFRVGLRAVSGDGSGSPQASAAAELRAQAERERHLEAERRQQEAIRLARELLESERRKLDPALARLEKPKAAEMPELALPQPDAKKLTVEDLARIIEELREPPRAKETPPPRTQEPVRVSPERLAGLRSLSREQLEGLAREALQPKAAARELKPSAAPADVPGLAENRTAEKTTLAPEELIPAIEALKQENLIAMQEGERGKHEPAGTPTPEQFTQAVPSRNIGGGVGERAAIGSERVRIEKARAGAGQGKPEGESAFAGLAPLPVEGPAAERRAAAVLFPTPDEQPAADPLVELPGVAQQGDTAPQPSPVAIARGTASTPGVRRSDRPQSVVGAAPGPRGTVSLVSPTLQSPLIGPYVSRDWSEEGRRSSKLAPKLDELEVPEGPVVAARQGAERTEGEVVARPVATTLRPALVREAGERLAVVARLGAGAGHVSPRPGGAERLVSARATEMGLQAAGVQRVAAARAALPAADAHVDEMPEVAKQWGAPSDNKASEVPVPVSLEGRRQEVDTLVQRAELPSGRLAVRSGEGDTPRRGGPPVLRSPSELTWVDSPSGLGTAAPRADIVVPEAFPQEAIDAGPRVAKPSGGPAPLGPRVEPPQRGETGRGSLARATAWAVPSQESHPLSPRASTVRAARGGVGARLLLPELTAHGEAAGALVGEATGTVKSIVLTTVKYGGAEADWDCHRTAMPFLSWQLREKVGFNLETDVVDVPLASNKIMGSPWVFMTGHKDFRLADTEVANLRRYLLAGGTLWAEDCTHEDDPTWDRAFRREIARVLPPAEGYRLRKITREDDHPLFRACFDLSSGYKGYFPPPGDKFRQSYIEGIEIGGRLAVIYTRNDYGCGLEIKPDTHPGKVSLSSLSPAEMQESSFLMASNIIIYALSGGRGLADRGLAGKAAASLRRQREAAEAQGDPYDKAPATLFENFAEDRWVVETTWDKAGSATLRPLRRADPQAEGRRLAVTFQLAKEHAKTVLIRDLPQESDLSGQDRCYVEVESRLEGGARLAIALITMPDWKYFESRPAFIKPGRQRVWFDLKAPTWKTGEPVAEGEDEYSRKPINLQAVRRFVVLLYPIQSSGTVILDQIEFRAKP